MEQQTATTVSEQSFSNAFSDILNRNKHEITRIEEYKNAPISMVKRNLAFVAMLLVGVGLIGLFAAQIIAGATAVIVTLAVGVGGFFGIRFLSAMDPLIQQKTKNFLMEKMVEEARRNSSRQLDNQVLANAERLRQARAGRDKMGAALKNLRAKVEKANPESASYGRMKELCGTVAGAYDQIVINLEAGAKANELFATKVADFKYMEEVSEMASEAMAFFQSSSMDDIGQMLSLESFEQIETDFNHALVQIENTTRDMNTDA